MEQNVCFVFKRITLFLSQIALKTTLQGENVTKLGKTASVISLWDFYFLSKYFKLILN